LAEIRVLSNYLDLRILKRDISGRFPFFVELVIGYKPIEMKVFSATEETKIQHFKPFGFVPQRVQRSPFIYIILALYVVVHIALDVVLYYTWPIYDIPDTVDESSFYRVGSGYMAGNLPLLAFLFIECFRNLRNQYEYRRIANLFQFMIFGILCLFASILFTGIFNGILYLPGLSVELYVTPILGSYSRVVNMLVTFSILLTVLRLVPTLFIKWRNKREKGKYSSIETQLEE